MRVGCYGNNLNLVWLFLFEVGFLGFDFVDLLLFDCSLLVGFVWILLITDLLLLKLRCWFLCYGGFAVFA